MRTPRNRRGRPSGAGAKPARVASWAAALAFTAALVCLALPVTAAEKYWIAGSGQWNVSGNWTPAGQPQAGDDVHLTQSDATDRVVTYSNTTNPTALLNSLTIDATGLGTMTLDMPNDHALSVTTECVGYNGQGAVTRSAGTHTAKTPYLGYSAAERMPTTCLRRSRGVREGLLGWKGKAVSFSRLSNRRGAITVCRLAVYGVYYPATLGGTAAPSRLTSKKDDVSFPFKDRLTAGLVWGSSSIARLDAARGSRTRPRSPFS